MAKTKEEIFAIMDDLKSRGIKTTNAAVYKVVRGSLTTLAPIVREYNDRDRRIGGTSLEAEHDPVAPDKVSVPDYVVRLRDAVEAALAPIAGHIQQNIAAAVDAERRAGRGEIAAMQITHQLAIDDLAKELTDGEDLQRTLSEESDQRAAGIEGRDRTIGVISTERDALSKRVTTLESEIKHAAEKLDAAEQDSEALGFEIEEFGKAVTKAQADAVAADARAQAALEDAQRLRDQITAAAAAATAARDQAADLRTELAVSRKGEQSEAARVDRAEKDIERLRTERASAEVIARETAIRADAERAELRGGIERIRAKAEADLMSAAAEIEALRHRPTIGQGADHGSEALAA